MATDGKSEHDQHFLFYWSGLSVLLLIADYFSGPFIQFPITYLIPVALSSWYKGRRVGTGLRDRPAPGALGLQHFGLDDTLVYH